MGGPLKRSDHSWHRVCWCRFRGRFTGSSPGCTAHTGWKRRAPRPQIAASGCRWLRQQPGSQPWRWQLGRRASRPQVATRKEAAAPAWMHPHLMTTLMTRRPAGAQQQLRGHTATMPPRWVRRAASLSSRRRQQVQQRTAAMATPAATAAAACAPSSTSAYLLCCCATRACRVQVFR